MPLSWLSPARRRWPQSDCVELKSCGSQSTTATHCGASIGLCGIEINRSGGSRKEMGGPQSDCVELKSGNADEAGQQKESLNRTVWN